MLMYFILKKIVIDQEQSSCPCGGHSGLMFLHWTMVQEGLCSRPCWVIVLHFLAMHFTLTVLFFTQEKRNY